MKRPVITPGYIPLALLAALIIIPAITFGIWYIQPDNQLQLRVVDKTVPDREYREHKALFWGLNHQKVLSPERSRWRLSEHYIGYYPGTPDLVEDRKTRLLDERDLEHADAVFIADTYGVYRGNNTQLETERPDHSPFIFGGLQASEARRLEQFVVDGGSLIAEFNSFASPTPDSIQQRFEKILGIEWSGWVGRYFEHLDSTEIPAWAIRNWEQKHLRSWPFEGPGLLLVHGDSRILVLRFPEDIASRGVLLDIHSGEDLTGWVNDTQYPYWFAVSETTDESKAVASFELDVTNSGRHRVDEFPNLTTTFPAVTINSEAPVRIYLAGDFSDSPENLGPYFFAGYDELNWLTAHLNDPLSARHRNWTFYQPLLTNIIDRIGRTDPG